MASFLKKRNPPTASPGRTIRWLRSSNFQTWEANPDFLAHASWLRSSKTQRDDDAQTQTERTEKWLRSPISRLALTLAVLVAGILSDFGR